MVTPFIGSTDSAAKLIQYRRRRAAIHRERMRSSSDLRTLASQRHRCAPGTSRITASTWRPQPRQVVLLHCEQRAGEHMSSLCRVVPVLG